MFGPRKEGFYLDAFSRTGVFTETTGDTILRIGDDRSLLLIIPAEYINETRIETYLTASA
jgi:hypothetical protein